MCSIGKIKMAQSRTSKKINKKIYKKAQNQALAETATTVMAYLIEHWTADELDRMSRNGDMLFIDLGKGYYRVGRFNLRRITPQCWRVTDLTNRLIHDFFNKQAAVFFCMYETKHHFTSSNKILHSDIRLGRMNDALYQYNIKLKKAEESGDGWRLDLYLARISGIKPMFDAEETNLLKTINHAKYSKVWDTKNHETARHSH